MSVRWAAPPELAWPRHRRPRARRRLREARRLCRHRTGPGVKGVTGQRTGGCTSTPESRRTTSRGRERENERHGGRPVSVAATATGRGGAGSADSNGAAHAGGWREGDEQGSKGPPRRRWAALGSMSYTHAHADTRGLTRKCALCSVQCAPRRLREARAACRVPRAGCARA